MMTFFSKTRVPITKTYFIILVPDKRQLNSTNAFIFACGSGNKICSLKCLLFIYDLIEQLNSDSTGYLVSYLRYFLLS